MAFAERLSRIDWRQLRSRFHLNEESRRFLRRSLFVALGFRIGLILAAYVTGYLIIGREHASIPDILYETFNRWDASHYLRIAEVGYRDEEGDRLFIVFFPLYPLLIAIVNVVLHSYFLSGLLVSALAAAAAGYLIQTLIAIDGGDDAEADRGLWYMTFFPTAFFMALPYTESLFLATSLASFVAARRRRWAWSGVFGMLAVLTRMQGVMLGPALAVEALLAHRWTAPLRAFWLALLPLGFLAYLGLNWHVLGDPFEFLEIQRDHWYHTSVWPWQSLEDIRQAIATSGPGPTRTSTHELILGAIILTAALLVIGVRWLRPSYQVYGWLSLLLMLSTTFPISLPRYIFGIFPLFLVLARLGRSPGVHQVLLPTSIVFMGALFVIYATRWGF